MGSNSAIVPRLVIIEGKEKGKVIQLRSGTVVIGRSKGDVLIQDPRISRSHVALHFDPKSEKLSCTDLKSLNGTMVNGETIESSELRDGDKLQLGDTLLDTQLSPVEETLASYRVAPQKVPPSSPKPRSERREPAAVLSKKTTDRDESPDEDEDFSSPPLAFLKRHYQNVPKPVRIVGLLLLLGFAYSQLGGTFRKPSPEVLEREIGSIRALENDGKVDQAIDKAEKITKQFPESSGVFLVLGDLYAAQNKREQAIAAYRSAHELQPPQPIVHLRLIRQYLRTGFVKEGMEELKHVEVFLKDAQDSPQTKEIFIETANLFLEFKDELKQPPEKLFIIAKALQNQIATDRAIGYKLEAETYLQRNKYPEAIEVLERGLKLEPKDEASLNTLVKAKIFAQDMAGAQRTIESWMQIAPTATRPLIVAAFLKFNEKNYLDALPYLQRVVSLLAKTPHEPDYGQALHNMGLIYHEQNQLTEAENFFRQACDLGVQDSCLHPLLKPAGGDSSKAPASLPQDSSGTVKR
jgi:pSer/pThr/pTyr-binding forkhead associated (FHA) protein/Tfp pilus assembly protein PilF